MSVAAVLLTLNTFNPSSASGLALLTEGGDKLLLESGDLLLQDVVVLSTNALQMETGDRLLLENGDLLLFDESGDPPGPPVSTSALLDVFGGELLDVNGQAFLSVI